MLLGGGAATGSPLGRDKWNLCPTAGTDMFDGRALSHPEAGVHAAFP